MNEAPVLDRDAHPEFGAQSELRLEFGKPVLSFRQHLERVPVCRSASSSKTLWMKSGGMSSWKKSDIELTKIVLGFLQRSGISSRSGQSLSPKPCSYGWPRHPAPPFGERLGIAMGAARG